MNGKEKETVDLMNLFDELWGADSQTVSIEEIRKEVKEEPAEDMKEGILEAGQTAVEFCYVRPEGLELAMIKAVKNGATTIEKVTKEVEKYLNGELQKALTDDEVLEGLHHFFAPYSNRCERMHVHVVPIEMKGGTNDYVYLFNKKYGFANCPAMLLSPYGLKSRRRWCYSASQGTTFIDSEALVFLTLFNYFKKKMNTEESRVARTIRKVVRDIVEERLNAYVGERTEVLLIPFTQQWSAEKRRQFLADFAPYVKVPMEDADNIPADYRRKEYGYSVYRMSIERQCEMLYDVELEPDGIFQIHYAEEYTFQQIARALETEDRAEKAMAEYSRVLGQTAKVWQTLKNHTDVSVAEQRATGFNSYFKLIEFDHGLKLQEVEDKYFEDFRDIVENVLGGWHDENCELRIRKLGRHRAAGIFFPQRWCLCVDVDSPYSLMHEFGHLYDHAHGSLSREWEFHKVRDKYEEEVRKAIGGKEREKEIFKSSKYNMKYFTAPTEIFARTFEMWLNRSVGISNKVVGPNGLSGFEYPENEDLKRLVEEYFDRLFDRKQLPDIIRNHSGAQKMSA